MYTNEQAEAWRREYGADNVRVVRTRGGVSVYRRPARTEWDRYIDAIRAKPDETSACVRELAQSCLLYPEPTAWRAWLDDQPAVLLGAVNDALSEMAGLINAEVEVAKL